MACIDQCLFDGGFDSRGFPLELNDPFTTFEVDGTTRTTTFAGTDLTPGTILGTVKKENPCGLEIRLFVLVGN